MTELEQTEREERLDELAGELEDDSELEEVVRIRWKDAEVLELELDRDAIKFKDVLKLQSVQAKAQAGEITEEEAMDALIALLTQMTGLDIANTSVRIVRALMDEIPKLMDSGQTKIKNSKRS